MTDWSAAFVIESYKSLSCDSGDQVAILLGQILAAATNWKCASAEPSTSVAAFTIPITVVLANVIWVVNLVVALTCALLATLA